MKFLVDYSEMMTYEEHIEADSLEEASKLFLLKLNKGEFYPMEAQVSFYDISQEVHSVPMSGGEV